MRAAWLSCLLLVLVCGACEHKGRPAFTSTAEEIDAFFDPLIKSAITREAAQKAAQKAAKEAAREAGQTPDQMVGQAEVPPDQPGQEAR